MQWACVRSLGAVSIAALMAAACATPAPPAGTTAPAAVHYRVYDAPRGVRNNDSVHILADGARAGIWTAAVDLDVVLPGISEQDARQALRVEGAALAGAPRWQSHGVLSLRLAPGRPGDVVTVRAGSAVLTLTRAVQAEVEVFQRYGNEWRPVSMEASTAPTGAAELRLVFSRPVQREEVERSLVANPRGPLRGLMTWADDRTLIWQIAVLPDRLDFLLGSAHDQQGLPLPGGLPSLRTSPPPVLAEVDLANPADLVRARLPQDILEGVLTPDGKQINLKVWQPGTSPWDWQTVDYYWDIGERSLKPGRVEGLQPRIVGSLESWVINPQGAALAGLQTNAPGSSDDPGTAMADLVVQDIRGGRQAVFRNFVRRRLSPEAGDLTTHLAWSSEGSQVAALHHTGREPWTSDLIALDCAAGKREVLLRDLPLPAGGTRLAWAPGGRHMLAGNLLIDLQTGRQKVLAGLPDQARGQWEPGGRRLLYSTQDWGALLVIDALTGESKPLGSGFAVGWSAPGRVLVLRWAGSNTRYVPPGM